MTKSGKSSSAKNSHRKVQVSSARNRKSVSRPVSTKKVAKKSVKSTGVKASQVKVTKKAPVRVDSKNSKVIAKSTEKQIEKATTQAKEPVIETNPAEQPIDTKERQYIKVKFIDEEVEKRPLNSSLTKMDVVSSGKIRHFAEMSDAAMLAEMDQVGKTSSQSLALEKALSDFEAEHPEIDEQQPTIKNFDITRVNERMSQRKQEILLLPEGQKSAKEIKESAIQKAMQNVEREENKYRKKHRASRRVNFGFKRVILALGCAMAAVFAIVYFVNLNAPNVSLKVAAMQSGIEASYPSYVPRDFSLSDITSEKGKITLNFKNASSGESFSIVEESSSWDSTALLNNYVKSEYGDDYAVVKEQGLTLYMGSRAMCWVNGKVVYKLKITSGSLTKKQLKAIAVSL